MKSNRNTLLCVFTIYTCSVLWYTVLSRTTELYTAELDVFWSYRKWINGDSTIGKEIFLNILMFIPFGFLINAIFLKKKHYCIVVISSLAFSLRIELLQYVLMRGHFEWDDIFNNVIGGLIGCLIYGLVDIYLSNKRIISFFGILIILVCLIVVINSFMGNNTSGETTRTVCLQIDKVEYEDPKTIKLTGFAFRCDAPSKIKLILCSTKNAKRIKLKLNYEDLRPDVNEYFLCEHDYTNSGFVAVGKADITEEYEVMIAQPLAVPVSAGVYIKGTDIYSIPSEKYEEPQEPGSGLKRIIEQGYLLAYNPDYHCWIFQYEGALYWVMDKEYPFEADGSTIIEYQLWTTQVEKLPQARLENGLEWDNRRCVFEENELKGDFGEYRVMRKELPKEYSVTSILTGYYTDKWIWKEFFRPHYTIHIMVI